MRNKIKPNQHWWTLWTFWEKHLCVTRTREVLEWIFDVNTTSHWERSWVMTINTCKLFSLLDKPFMHIVSFPRIKFINYMQNWTIRLNEQYQRLFSKSPNIPRPRKFTIISILTSWFSDRDKCMIFRALPSKSKLTWKKYFKFFQIL